MKLLCYLISHKWREYTFSTASFLNCERCGETIL